MKCQNRASQVRLPKQKVSKIVQLDKKRTTSVILACTSSCSRVPRADHSRVRLGLSRHLPFGFSSCIFAPIDRAPRTALRSVERAPPVALVPLVLALHEGVVL